MPDDPEKMILITVSLLYGELHLLSRQAHDSYSFPLTILADSSQISAAPLYLPYDFKIAHIIQELI